MDDDHYMARALIAAKKSLTIGEFPVGAVLCIDNEEIAVAHNAIVSTRTLVAHAEALLLIRNGPALMAAWQNQKLPITIYTTLEPCLMCLSSSAHSRVTRIVYACRDPMAGGGQADPPSDWYKSAWPKLEHLGTLEKESATLLLQYTQKRPGWDAFQDALKGVLLTKE